MAKTTISLNIPKSAAERAARSVLFDILGQYRVGDINHEQAAEAIEHWRTSVSASLQGEDAVERVARIIDPDAMRLYDECRASGKVAANGKLWADVAYSDGRNGALTKARAILATGLVPDEAAIRAVKGRALDLALASLAEIASSYIPDCPAHYAGDELAWAQRHVGNLRRKAEIAHDGIAAAIRSGGVK